VSNNLLIYQFLSTHSDSRRHRRKIKETKILSFGLLFVFEKFQFFSSIRLPPFYGFQKKEEKKFVEVNNQGLEE
jgi:hypothetical protein